MNGPKHDLRHERRKLTPFLAHEMLFDFATDQLDPNRKAAIEEFIKEDRESQNLLEAIRRGIKYAETLRDIDLTEQAFQELDQAENLVSLSRRIVRWSEWPDSLRWSIVALTVSVCTAGIVVAIPWKTVPLFRSGPSFDSGSIEIAKVESRVNRSEDGTVVADNGDESQSNESGPLEGSGDEEFSEEASGAVPAQAPMPAPPPRVAATPFVIKPVPTAIAALTKQPVGKTAAGSTSTVPPRPAAAAPTVVAAAPGNATGAEASAASSTSSNSKASRSFVYRAFMTLSDLESIAPKITQQMKELGAEKAGEVELGWRRGSGRYYHFTIPEANEQKLLENLRVYGPVRISKDPHPRVMPEGQVRFILWIESGS